MTNEDRCPDCGGLYSLIGYRHLCRKRVLVAKPEAVVKEPEVENPKLEKRKVKTLAGAPKGYKYRDAEKWKAYMKEYMRKRRAKVSRET